MRVLVLGWGSLAWDPRGLRIAGGFQPNGPALRLEFSRISRDGRLTLVIDEISGAPCATLTAVSSFRDPAAAREDLRLREEMPSQKRIGFVSTTTNEISAIALERHPTAVATIKEWSNAKCRPAVIWTALASNFRERTNEPFSVAAGIRYLENLDASTRQSALHYIRKAPAQVQTPLRETVKARWPQSD
jgi:hypothetical protein